jgi:phage-related protein|nr:MAG TPA: distal tail protein [Herelleviridae sp.]
MAIALKGDFIGFSFNGYRSEELGIVRVSDGSRYDEDLLPTSQDKIVQVPGGDGFYYFGSDYTQRQFSINIAFDELTEAQFRKLQQVFGTKELGKLIFDERPYKYYMVKSGNPQLKYICFGKEGEPRIYKGEGTLTFTAYYPFAKSVFKFLEKTQKEGKEVYVLQGTYSNIEEWAEASGMKAQGTLDKVPKNPTGGVYSISVYNAGDREADFILKFNGAPSNAINIELSQQNVADKKAFLNLKNFGLKGTDTGFQINTKTNLIEGFNTKGLTGILYNENIIQGDFFKIPPQEEGLKISITGATPTEIVYDYIYY